MRRAWERSLPFTEAATDRWERAASLGFGEQSSIHNLSYVYGRVAVGAHTWIGPYTVLDGSGGLTIGARALDQRRRAPVQPQHRPLGDLAWRIRVRARGDQRRRGLLRRPACGGCRWGHDRGPMRGRRAGLCQSATGPRARSRSVSRLASSARSATARAAPSSATSNCERRRRARGR